MSIKTWGWTNPILVQRSSSRVIAGHGRLMAAKEAGMREVPVIYLDLDDKAASVYTIADNKLAENSAWDMPKLKNLILELDGLGQDLTLTGFAGDELEKVLAHDPRVSLKDLEPRAIKMAWVLVGVPIGDYPEIADLVEKAGKVPGSVVEVTVNDREAHADR